MLSALALAATMLGSSLGVDLRDDPRLQVAVSLEHPAKSIETILMDLSGKTNVRIEAADDIRQDLATLRVASRPAHEVMERIARHFGWAWEEKDDGYRLYRPAESRVAEEKALRKQLLQPYFDAQEDARRYLAQVSGAERMLARARELVAALAVETDIDKRWALRDEWWELSPYLDGDSWLGALLLCSLTESDFARIESDGKMVFSSHPTAAQRALPPAVMAELPLLGELALLRVEQPDRQVSPPSVVAVRVAVEGVQVGALGPEGVKLRTAWFGPDGLLLEGLADPVPFDEPQGPTHEEGPPDAERRLPKDLPEAFREPWNPPTSIRRILVGMSPFSDSERSELRASLYPGLVSVEPLEPVTSAMLAAASRVGVNLISDAYDAHIVLPLHAAGSSLDTVEGFFEALSHARGATVELTDGWLTFRTENWPLVRAATVPREHLYPFARVVQRGAVEFSAMAEFVAGLASVQVTRGVLPWQLTMSSSLFEVNRATAAFARGWQALGRSMHDTVGTRYEIRWGSLPERTKREWNRFFLLHGLEDCDHFELLTYLFRWSERVPTPPDDSQRDIEGTQVIPNGMPADTLLTLTSDAAGGVAHVEGESRIRVIWSVESAARLWVTATERGHTRYQYHPAELEVNLLRVALPSGPVIHIVFGGATVDVSVRYESLERLPGPLGERLRRAIEAERARRAPPPRH
ncbi:MAG: hypothetical protein AB1725_00125 [Armatimonadota bacterium]